jgi:hypothetical protein
MNALVAGHVGYMSAPIAEVVHAVGRGIRVGFYGYGGPITWLDELSRPFVRHVELTARQREELWRQPMAREIVRSRWSRKEPDPQSDTQRLSSSTQKNNRSKEIGTVLNGGHLDQQSFIYGIACIQCREILIAPDWSKYVSPRLVRHAGPANIVASGLRLQTICNPPSLVGRLRESFWRAIPRSNGFGASVKKVCS